MADSGSAPLVDHDEPQPTSFQFDLGGALSRVGEGNAEPNPTAPPARQPQPQAEPHARSQLELNDHQTLAPVVERPSTPASGSPAAANSSPPVSAAPERMSDIPDDAPPLPRRSRPATTATPPLLGREAFEQIQPEANLSRTSGSPISAAQAAAALSAADRRPRHSGTMPLGDMTRAGHPAPGAGFQEQPVDLRYDHTSPQSAPQQFQPQQPGQYPPQQFQPQQPGQFQPQQAGQYPPQQFQPQQFQPRNLGSISRSSLGSTRRSSSSRSSLGSISRSSISRSSLGSTRRSSSNRSSLGSSSRSSLGSISRSSSRLNSPSSISRSSLGSIRRSSLGSTRRSSTRRSSLSSISSKRPSRVTPGPTSRSRLNALCSSRPRPHQGCISGRHRAGPRYPRLVQLSRDRRSGQSCRHTPERCPHFHRPTRLLRRPCRARSPPLLQNLRCTT